MTPRHVTVKEPAPTPSLLILVGAPDVVLLLRLHKVQSRGEAGRARRGAGLQYLKNVE